MHTEDLQIEDGLAKADILNIIFLVIEYCITFFPSCLDAYLKSLSWKDNNEGFPL